MSFDSSVALEASRITKAIGIDESSDDGTAIPSALPDDVEIVTPGQVIETQSEMFLR